MLLGGVAHAQTPAPASSAPATQAAPAGRTDRYVEGFGGWTFGEKGSQFFGGEFGFPWKPNIHIFVEAGRVNNAGGSAIREAADRLEQGLAQITSGATVDAEQPTFFVGGGLRYSVPIQGSRAQPFVLGGAGVSNVKHDVTVMVNGQDVTSSLEQIGVALGTDLSGSFTKAHIVLGGGLAISINPKTFFEISYRMLHIFAEDSAITVNRAGLGLGVRF